MGNYLGAALMGAAQGMQQEQAFLQDQDFQQKSRANALQQQQLANQETALDIQTKRMALDDAQYEATMWQKMGQPGAQNPASLTNQPTTNNGGQVSAVSQPVDPGLDHTSNFPDWAAHLDPARMDAATPTVESNNNPNAVGPTKNGDTPVGAWQTEGRTLKDPGFGITPAKDNSPAEEARVGKDYMSAMEKRYGSPAIASVAYNMGPGKTDKWLADGGDFNKLPQETKDYLRKKAQVSGVDVSGAQNSAKGAPLATTPQARAVDNLKANDVDLTSKQLDSAVASTNAMADKLDQAAMQAFADGKSKIGLKLQDQALALRKKGLDLSKEKTDIQEKAAKDITREFDGIDPKDVTQAEWTSLNKNLAGNPMWERKKATYGITGDLEQDKKAIPRLQRESLTLAQQQMLDLRAKNEQDKLVDEKNKQEAAQLKLQQQKENENASALLSDDSKANLAQRLRNGENLSQVWPGFGPAAQKVRSELTNIASAMDRREGRDPEEAAKVRLMGQAAQVAYKDQVKKAAVIEGFEKTARENAKLAEEASEKLKRTDFQSLNEWIGKTKEELNDPDQIRFVEYNDTFAQEYAKVMVGIGGQSTEGARAHALDLISKSRSVEGYRAQMEALRNDMDNRLKGLDDEQRILVDRLSGKRPGGATGKWGPDVDAAQADIDKYAQ